MNTIGLPIMMGHDVFLTGDESWPIMGNLITKKWANMMIKRFAKYQFKRHWNCFEKAYCVMEELGQTAKVAVGDLTIFSHQFESTYGFIYNPPFEFHAWVEYKGGIIDIALPGAIEIGQKACDENGPFIVGRNAIILATDQVPKWLKYNAVEHFIKT